MGHIKYKINEQAARELYAFIRSNLNVINNAPYVEQLMFTLEDEFNLPSDTTTTKVTNHVTREDLVFSFNILLELTQDENRNMSWDVSGLTDGQTFEQVHEQMLTTMTHFDDQVKVIDNEVE